MHVPSFLFSAMPSGTANPSIVYEAHPEDAPVIKVWNAPPAKKLAIALAGGAGTLENVSASSANL